MVMVLSKLVPFWEPQHTTLYKDILITVKSKYMKIFPIPYQRTIYSYGKIFHNIEYWYYEISVKPFEKEMCSVEQNVKSVT
jgi:hypothetical protein